MCSSDLETFKLQNIIPINPFHSLSVFGGGCMHASQQCVFVSEGAMAVVNMRDVGVLHKGHTLFLVFHTLIVINY